MANPMQGSDILFTFDTTMFTKAISTMKDGMGKFKDKLSEMADGIKVKFAGGFEKIKEHGGNAMKGLGNVISGAVSKGVMIAEMAFEGLKKGVDSFIGAIKEFVPEIDIAFGLAKDIALKNFFYPLRKEMLPYLQKMLDWVKDHRALFVQWGTVVVNIFRMVKTAAEAVWNILKPIRDVIDDFVRRFLGENSFTEMINIILFKLTVMAIALQKILKPIFDTFGTVLGEFIDNMGVFFQSFVNNIDPKVIDSLIDSLTRFLKKLGEVIGSPAFKTFYHIMGEVLAGAFNTLAIALDHVLTLITAILNSDWEMFNANMAKLSGYMMGQPFDYVKELQLVRDINKYKKRSDVEELYKMYRDVARNTDADKMVQWAKNAGINVRGIDANVEDAIITKDGKVIKTSPDDNIFATKGGMGGSVNINVGGMTLYVTEGNAKVAGENFVGGMESQIRRILLDNTVLQGGH